MGKVLELELEFSFYFVMSEDEVDISVFVSAVEDSDSDEGNWRGSTRRDKYGFELEEDVYSDSYIRNASRSSHQEEESQTRWKRYFPQLNSGVKSPKNKLRTLIHKYGIPAEFRKDVSYLTLSLPANIINMTYKGLVEAHRHRKQRKLFF